MFDLYLIKLGFKAPDFKKKNKVYYLHEKDSYWYNFNKNVGESNYNKYREYKITIPDIKLTCSNRLIDNSKILVLDEENIKNFPDRSSLLKSDLFGGVDSRNIKESDITSKEFILWNFKGLYIKEIERGK